MILTLSIHGTPGRCTRPDIFMWWRGYTILRHVITISLDGIEWSDSYNKGRTEGTLQPDGGNAIELNFGIECPLAVSWEKSSGRSLQGQGLSALHDGSLENKRGENMKEGFAANWWLNFACHTRARRHSMDLDFQICLSTSLQISNHWS